MTVGISLLTLVPGVVGGSETYARELVRALGRVGELDYRIFKPSIAEEGLPGKTVSSYRARRSMRGRVAAMTRAASMRPDRLRRFSRTFSMNGPSRESEVGKRESISSQAPQSSLLPPLRPGEAPCGLQDRRGGPARSGARERFPGSQHDRLLRQQVGKDRNDRVVGE